jgi:uracil-DNA glycosylase
VITLISAHNDGCVFLLWGNFAHKKEILIDCDESNGKKHKVIKSAHPSPLSFQKFLNSKCFSQANQHLKSIGKSEIDWSLN